MNKIFQKIWEEYKKSNAASKLRMLKKYGFSKVEDFMKMLGVPVESTTKKIAKKVAASKTSAPKKVVKKKVVSEEVKPLRMCVAFDTTGSMRDYIGAVRQQVEQTINELFDKTPGLVMKLVAFGDYCDSASTRYQSTAMTNNRQALIDFVRNAKDTNGGDSDEFYEYVIKEVVENTDWGTDTQKSFLLIGDAEPHELGYSYGKEVKKNQIDWRVEANKAKSLGIQIDTLRIHEGIDWYKELSDITGGVCMEFQTASKTAQLVTGLTYVRGSKAAFTATMDSVMASGDEELIGAYKTMTSLL